jgi:hypothetical protein
MSGNILTGKYRRKKLFEDLVLDGKYTIKMDHRKMGYEELKWIMIQSNSSFCHHGDTPSFSVTVDLMFRQMSADQHILCHPDMRVGTRVITQPDSHCQQMAEVGYKN